MPPDTMTGGPAAVDQSKAGLSQLVQQLIQQSSARKMQPSQPSPRPGYGPEDTKQQGYMMGNQGSNKAEIGASMANFGTFVSNMVAQHKQNQVRDAAGVWGNLSRAMENAQAVAGPGDPSDPEYQKKVVDIMSKDPWVASNLNPANPKAMKHLKNMQKAFDVNLLGGEGDSDNVYREGLKQHFKIQKALQHVKEIGGKLANHKAQAQSQQAPQQGSSPEQQQAGLAGVLKQFMGQQSVQQPDPARQERAAQLGIEEKRAEQDKYEFKQGVDPESGKPQWFAFDKTNPQAQAKRVQIDGKDITATTRPSQTQGKPVMVEGKPVAIMGPTGAVYPGSPEWTEDYQKKYDASNKGWADAEASKQKLAGIRAQTYIQSREYGVIDTTTGQMVMLNPSKINASPGRYAPASGGAAAMGKEAVFKDIYYNENNVREAAKALKNGFDTKSRAQFILAMRSTDPANAFSTFLSSQAATTLKPDQIDYLTAVASLQENAQALRSVAGFGAGSDMLREAILRTVPGQGTPSIQMLNRQLDLFKGTAQRLETGVPGVMKKDIVTDKKDLD